MFLHLKQIQANMSLLSPVTDQTDIFPIQSFNVDFDWDPTRTLILMGPSGSRKTNLAKALLGPGFLLVSQVDKLKEFDAEKHSGIVLDECDWLRILPRTSQINILDRHETRQIWCRNNNAEIPAGVRMIGTTNAKRPSDIMLYHDEAIRRRVQIVMVRGVGDYDAWDLDQPEPTVSYLLVQ